VEIKGLFVPLGNRFHLQIGLIADNVIDFQEFRRSTANTKERKEKREKISEGECC
jgi:hypothetical protein